MVAWSLRSDSRRCPERNLEWSLSGLVSVSPRFLDWWPEPCVVGTSQFFARSMLAAFVRCHLGFQQKWFSWVEFLWVWRVSQLCCCCWPFLAQIACQLGTCWDPESELLARPSCCRSQRFYSPWNRSKTVTSSCWHQAMVAAEFIETSKSNCWSKIAVTNLCCPAVNFEFDFQVVHSLFGSGGTSSDFCRSIGQYSALEMELLRSVSCRRLVMSVAAWCSPAARFHFEMIASDHLPCFSLINTVWSKSRVSSSLGASSFWCGLSRSPTSPLSKRCSERSILSSFGASVKRFGCGFSLIF